MRVCRIESTGCILIMRGPGDRVDCINEITTLQLPYNYYYHYYHYYYFYYYYSNSLLLHSP
jgi:hypothetical protein